MSEQLEQFIKQCVAMQRQVELQLRMETEREQEENFQDWIEVMEKVCERLPEVLRDVVELPAYVDFSDGPDHRAFVVVRMNGAANLRVYEQPGAVRYPENGDYYSRVPAYEVGRDGRLEACEDGELVTVYGHWQEFKDLEKAVAAAYEESSRPLQRRKPAVPVEQPGLFALCPVLMLGYGRDSADCVKEECAWWVRDRCAVAVVAMGGRE